MARLPVTEVALPNPLFHNPKIRPISLLGSVTNMYFGTEPFAALCAVAPQQNNMPCHVHITWCMNNAYLPCHKTANKERSPCPQKRFANAITLQYQHKLTMRHFAITRSHLLWPSVLELNKSMHLYILPHTVGIRGSCAVTLLDRLHKVTWKNSLSPVYSPSPPPLLLLPQYLHHLCECVTGGRSERMWTSAYTSKNENENEGEISWDGQFQVQWASECIWKDRVRV